VFAAAIVQVLRLFALAGAALCVWGFSGFGASATAGAIGFLLGFKVLAAG